LNPRILFQLNGRRTEYNHLMKLIRDINKILEKKISEKKMCLIAASLLELATEPIIRSELQEIDKHVKDFMSVLEGENASSVESALLTIYIHLHSAGATYASSEKELLMKWRGYKCHPGGLSPLIMAEQFIKPESIVADLGAGNGLQGLLLQRLYPHKKTLLIELSSEMIRIGRIFREVLRIPAQSVEWIHDDIINVSLDAADFVYLYRPAEPLDSGKELYQAIARKLAGVRKPLIIFSVADCLAPFLDEQFSMLFTDGHLTCFVKK